MGILEPREEQCRQGGRFVGGDVAAAPDWMRAPVEERGDLNHRGALPTALPGLDLHENKIGKHPSFVIERTRKTV